jgi:hypothetical protein
MRHIETNDLRDMERDAIRAELTNRVYDAAIFLEQLEVAGLISGNGHHKAQRIAQTAVDEMNKAWIE